MNPAPHDLFVLEHEPFDEGAAAVVLVHGTMDRSAAFGRVIPSLSDLLVITYDRRGYGRSAGARPPGGLDDHVDDLLSILGERPVTAVGHSYGAVVAMLASVRSPHAITAVGAFEPPMPWMEGWPQESSGGSLFASSDPGADAEAFFRRVAGDQAWDDLPSRTQAARRSEGPTLLADVASLQGSSPPFELADLTVPLLVGCGSASAPYQREGAQRLAELTGAELVTIDGGGHASHTSHPGEFAAFVRQTVGLTIR